MMDFARRAACVRRRDKRLRQMIAVACLVAVAGCTAERHGLQVERQAARVGISYRQTLTAAQKDDAALRRLLELADDVDEIGADEYANDLLDILAEVGERRFLIALNSLQGPVRAEVLWTLRCQSGHDYQRTYGNTWRRFQDAYPALAAIVSAAAEAHVQTDQTGE